MSDLGYFLSIWSDDMKDTQATGFVPTITMLQPDGSLKTFVEKRNYDEARAEVDTFKGLIGEWKQALELCREQKDAAKEYVDNVRAENDRLRAALELYANPKNWRSTHGNGCGVDDTIIYDCEGGWGAGSRARKALNGES